MKKPTQRPVGLHEPELALDSYLATLLCDVEEYTPEQTVQVLEPQVIQKSAEIVDFPATAVVAPPPAVETEVKKPLTTADKLIDNSPELPEWARQPFQCLFFKLRGMTLAVPLITLRGILAWKKDLVNIPGQPDWHLGLSLNRGEKLGIVDTARLIMPERVTAKSPEAYACEHILVIGEGNWGLACERLLHPRMLIADQVKWRGMQSKHPWMLGTVKEKLSILLDVDGLLKMIRHE